MDLRKPAILTDVRKSVSTTLETGIERHSVIMRVILHGSPEHHDGTAKPLGSFWDLVKNGVSVSNQLACVFFVMIVYYGLKVEDDSSLQSQESYIFTLVGISSALLGTGCVYCNISLHEFLRYYSAVFMYTFAFTPIFYTLTQSISSDTILRLQVLLLILHLITLNYFDGNSPSIFSTNTATFAVICMVSRFNVDENSYDNPTTTQTASLNDHAYFKSFALIMLGIELLIVWPIVRCKMGSRSKLLVSITMIALSFYQAYLFSKVAVNLLLNILLFLAITILYLYTNTTRTTTPGTISSIHNSKLFTTINKSD